MAVPAVATGQAFGAEASTAPVQVATQDDADQTYEAIYQCANTVADVVVGAGVKGATAAAIETSATVLKGIASNAPSDPKAAVREADNVLAGKLADVVGKEIKTARGTFRVSLGKAISAAQCITFVQIATSTQVGPEQSTGTPDPDCIPPANNLNWRPPEKCFLGYRPPPSGDGKKHQPSPSRKVTKPMMPKVTKPCIPPEGQQLPPECMYKLKPVEPGDNRQPPTQDQQQPPAQHQQPPTQDQQQPPAQHQQPPAQDQQPPPA